jgi:hypothetical protein
MAFLASKTGHVYPSLDTPPYTAANYGPLYYLSLGGIGRLFHADFPQLRIVGRLAMFVCFLLTVAIAWRWRGILAGALILGEIDFLEWNASGRPDMAAILCNACGLWMLASGHVAIAGLLGGVAVLFKQSYVALLGAGVVWLFWNRRYADLRRFALAAVAPAALVFGVLALRENEILTHLTAHDRTLDPGGAIILLINDFRAFPHHAVLLALAVFASVRGGLLAMYFCAAWGVALVGLLPIGADSNYLLEPWMAAVFVVPVALRNLNSRAAQACVIALVLASAALEARAWRYAMARPNRNDHYEHIAALLRDRSVFSSRPDVATLSRQPEILDSFPARQLERVGRWSEAPVLPRLRNQTYDFVVAAGGGYRGQPMLSEAVSAAIDREYRPWCAIDGVTVLIPRTREVPGSRELLRIGCNRVAPGKD